MLITATDKDGEKATYRFTLEVTNVNIAPKAVADDLSVPEDTVSNLNVLENDTDEDLITNPFTEELFVNSVSTTSENASVSIATGGKALIRSIDNFNGEVNDNLYDQRRGRAGQQFCDSTITVTQVNDAPAPVATRRR